MIALSKTIWSNISLPTELVEEIENRKPSYMSVSEFIRFCVRSYLDIISKQPVPEKMEVPSID